MSRVRPALLILAIAGCGYFNTLYNAQQSFAEARRAEERGDTPVAAAAYREAIGKAAASFRSHPDGRWADDALLLIARARFALGEDTAARAAALRALTMSDDGDVRAIAHAHAGAAAFRLGDVAGAQPHLDSAVVHDVPDARDMALLWRARARWLRNGDPAWDDLDRVRLARGAVAAEAGLEAARRSLDVGDTARTRDAIERLFRNDAAARRTEAVAQVIDDIAVRHGPAFAASVTLAVEQGEWPPAGRDHHRLRRLDFLAAAGDTAQAVDEALRLADRSPAGTAGPARVRAAALQLARARTVETVVAVRATLLPVIADDQARRMLRAITALEALLDRAAGGQPLALFAAAELSRDEFGARAVARQLFLAYADLVPDALWATKALLAAAELPGQEGDAPIDVRLVTRGNVYADALAGRADPAAFTTAEERLARSLAALRQDALREADVRDVRVARVAATLDSIRIAARADSMRLACGSLVDSLALAGVRADSVRAACVRGDSARLALYLDVDSLLLRDTTGILDDTARVRARRRGVRDTLVSGRT